MMGSSKQSREGYYDELGLIASSNTWFKVALLTILCNGIDIPLWSTGNDAENTRRTKETKMVMKEIYGTSYVFLVL